MKKRHHIVPRHYLDGWADDNERLTQVHLPGDRGHPVSTRDATVQRHFYTFDDDGTPNDEFEDFLGGIEDMAAPVMRDLAAGPSELSPNDRYAVAAWAAAQYLRTESQRRAIEDLADTILKLQIGVEGKPGVERALSTAGEEATEEAVDEAWDLLVDFDDWRTGLSPEAHLRAIVDMLPGTTRVFYARSWTVVRFRRRALLTSDTPVSLIAPLDLPPHMGVGVVTSDGALIPLARRAMLVMGPLGEPDRDLPGTTRVASMFNQHVAANARRAVFLHPADTALLDDVELPTPKDREIESDDLTRFVFPQGWPTSGLEGETDDAAGE